MIAPPGMSYCPDLTTLRSIRPVMLVSLVRADVVVCCDHTLEHGVHTGVPPLYQTIGVGGVAGRGGEPDPVDVAEGLHVLVEPLLPPIALNVLGRTEELYPVKQQSLCDCLSSLVGNESCRFEFCEGVNDIQDVRLRIFISDVFFEIDTN